MLFGLYNSLPYFVTFIQIKYHISNTSQAFLYPVILGTSGNYVFNMEMPLEQGDILQFRVSNGTASDTTYIDDIEVLLI